MRLRLGLALVVPLLLASGCGDVSGASSTTRLPSSDVVVRGWIDAVASGGAEKTAGLVASESLAFVIGIESRLEPTEITALVDEGIPVELVSGFWRSFEEAFTAIDGTDLTDLTVGAVTEFEAAGARFAAVGVGVDGRRTDVLLRRSLEGKWEIDVLATVGPGLTVQLAELAAQAVDDRFRTLFEQWVLPAIDAAARNDRDQELVTFVRDLRITFDRARG